MSLHVTEFYRIQERGYIREGYFADIVLIDLNYEWPETSQNIFSRCGWYPFQNQFSKSKIVKIFVNGNLVYRNGQINEKSLGKRLKFSKTR